MRVLHLITSLKPGGAENALLNYLTEAVLDKEDTHFVACIYDGPLVGLIEKIGIPVFRLSGKFLSYSPLLVLRLMFVIRRVKPDIIHSSLWSANIIARFFSKFTGIPLVCDLHGLCQDEGVVRNFLNRITSSVPARVVAVSNSVKESYCTSVVSLVKSCFKQELLLKKLVVIPNGVDFELLKLRVTQQNTSRSDFGLRDTDFVIGSVGRLEPIKAYDVLIKSFAQFFNRHNCVSVKLVLVGHGSQLKPLKHLTKNLGLEEHVIFTGFLQDAYRLYPLFDCFALSSKSEGLSIALLEAMTFGLPIITTHNGKVHDVIVDGINGILVQPFAINDFADAIAMLYRNDKLRKQMARSNSQLISERFSIRNVVSGYKKIYLDIMKD